MMRRNEGYILATQTEKYLNDYLRHIEKLCVPNSGYLQNFEGYFKVACNVFDKKFTVYDAINREEKVIIEISQEIFQMIRSIENKHYDATIYALITLAASYVCDRIQEREGVHTFVSPLSVTNNVKGEIRAMQNLKKLFGLPRNEQEQNWVI